MNIDDLLARALADEADAHEIDVTALRRDVQHRLSQERAGRGGTPVLAAASTVVVLVTGSIVGLALMLSGGDDREGRLYTDESSGEVSTEFTCPQVNTIDFRTTDDDGFLPDLSNGSRPAEVARMEHAPTYVFTTDGDRATLRLGNADGSLGSITTYARVGDGPWEMRTAQVCAGAGDVPFAPTADALQLGRHGKDPWPASRFSLGRDVAAGFVDDRPYYNLAGVIEGHRSMWVEPCGAGWCWVSGEPDSYLSTGKLPSSLGLGRPHVMSDLLANPDMMVGRENPFALWAHDVTEPSTFSAVLHDGTRVPAVEISQPEWGERRMLVVLARTSEVDRLELVNARGQTTAWDPAQLPAE